MLYLIVQFIICVKYWKYFGHTHITLSWCFHWLHIVAQDFKSCLARLYNIAQGFTTLYNLVQGCKRLYTVVIEQIHAF